MAADPESVAALRTIVPVSRIVFGSDFPFQKPEAAQTNISHFRNLEGVRPPEHVEMARGTVLQLFPRLGRPPRCEPV